MLNPRLPLSPFKHLLIGTQKRMLNKTIKAFIASAGPLD
jgi:hypothetical protein